VTAGKAVLFTAVLLAALGVWALVRRSQQVRGLYDLTVDEAAHEQALASQVVLLPDGFTCLRCYENPALPDRVWCAVCAPIVDALPAEPIDRSLDATIARHPAGKQRKTGGDR